MYFVGAALYNSNINQASPPMKPMAPPTPSMLNNSYQGKQLYTIVQEKDLGKGTFGSVKLVKEKISGKLYAMKIYSKEKVRTLRAEDNIRRELTLQSKLNFKNILKLHEHFEDKQDIFMVLEHCAKGNLYQLLRKRKYLTELEAFPLFYQLCQAVEYLHFQGIVHRDIKPENVLFYEDKSLKLCDFNWAKKLNPGQKCDGMICGTTEYMPPEVVAKQSHDLKVDVWSLGVILYEFFHGELPFKGNTQKEKIASILGNQLKMNPDLPGDLHNLITHLLNRISDQRPTFLQVYRSKWFLRMMSEMKYMSTPPRPQTVYTKGRGQQSERLSFFSNASQNTSSTAISKSRYFSTEKLSFAKANFEFKHLTEMENKLKSSTAQHQIKIVPVKAYGLNNTTVGFGLNSAAGLNSSGFAHNSNGFGMNTAGLSSTANKSYQTDFSDNKTAKRATSYAAARPTQNYLQIKQSFTAKKKNT